MTFIADNTNGTYSTAELEMLNAALAHMMSRVDSETSEEMLYQLAGSFSDRINNSFITGGYNTIASLTAGHTLPRSRG